MKMTRSTWTDERLDDLIARVVEMREEAREFRSEMHREFSGLHRTIVQVGCGLIGTLAVGILGLVGTQL
ncbi:MAG TPA: hypothetical protein VFS26_08555 [Solirubrobacterales bacterium]|nr:hypothetical protein [Solirubrobacterales bacterium]